MSTVVTCILALKDRFGSEHRSSAFLTRSDTEGSRRSMEAKLQRALTTPIMSGKNLQHQSLSSVFFMKVTKFCYNLSLIFYSNRS
jgi:hypothetical protein